MSHTLSESVYLLIAKNPRFVILIQILMSIVENVIFDQLQVKMDQYEDIKDIRINSHLECELLNTVTVSFIPLVI